MEPAEIREPGLLRRLAVDLGPLRRYPAFRRLFIGQTISTFGSEVAAVAAPYQLYTLTHSTLQVGLLSICELVPLLTLTATVRTYTSDTSAGPGSEPGPTGGSA